MPMSNAALAAANSVDGERLWSRLMQMAEIGKIPGNGVNRPCLSADDIKARALLISWAEARGWQVGVDKVANLFIRMPGTEPDAAPIVTGSHMDTQPQGGRFDGIYGVIAGLEALEAIRQSGVPVRRPVDVVAWTNEEGGRFAPGAMGSAVFTGAVGLDRFAPVKDENGVEFGRAVKETLAATPDAARRGFNFPIAGYVEAHIEQGPLLEIEEKTIGVVTGIQGCRWFIVEVIGETGHAGTSPLRTRKDALRESVAMISALQDLMADPSDTIRFTVGRVEVSPNTHNSVPERVRFTIDFRHPSPILLNDRGDRIAEVCRRAAVACAVEVKEVLTLAPIRFPEEVVGTIEAAADALGESSMRMPSGAFHDSQYLAAVCPSAMIFIPCEKGISHNPAEYATPEDCLAGARVLAATLVELANS